MCRGTGIEKGDWKMARSAKLLAIAGVVVSLLVVTGVTTSAGARSYTRSHTVAASSASPAVTSADFSFSLSLSGNTSDAVSLTGSGQIDFVNDALATSIVLPSNLAGLLGGGSVTAVISGGVLYLEVPGLSGSIGTPWISVPLPSGSLVGAFDTIATALGNVSQVVSFASSHGATISPLGSSTVDNTAVTGYLISAGSSAFSGKLTLWANSQDELVQAIVQVSNPAGGPSITLTFDLSGYNDPITFTTPPSSQVRAIPLPLVQQFPGGMVATTKPVKKMVGFTHSHLVKKGHPLRGLGG
jgi:hypothetical protein